MHARDWMMRLNAQRYLVFESSVMYPQVLVIGLV